VLDKHSEVKTVTKAVQLTIVIQTVGLKTNGVEQRGTMRDDVITTVE
jgi:hypothetical protein